MASAALLLSALGFAGYTLFILIRQDAVGPSYGYIYDDWPNGDHSDKDHWRGGTFFGVKADRIRWIAKPKRDSIDVHSIRFFARIPMSDLEFERLIARLKASEELAYRSSETFNSSRLFFVPDWFPRPEDAEFVCTARDESSWPVLIVRGQDDYTYLHLN